MRDIAHLLRPGHLAQLRRILDDPEASSNDRFVALDLLRNANIAAGGVLPMCQDTGTAIVMGRRGSWCSPAVATRRPSPAASSRPTRAANLRYSQLAPLDMYKEKNTGNNLPAQIELYATDGDEYKFLFMAKGGGSANKSFLFQETKALLNPASMRAFVEAKLRALGTSACPPYHLAVVVGGTSAEHCAQGGQAGVGALPRRPADDGQRARPRVPGPRARGAGDGRGAATGIGAQFGGKYFCHDVRVIRLPRHGASCPVGDRGVVLGGPAGPGKITRDGVFLEQLEHDPAQYLPSRATPSWARRWCRSI
jgi:fumarate hydratase class I